MASTTFTLYVPVRVVSGFFSTSIRSTRNLDNLRALLPKQHVPMVDERGVPTQPWYRFIDFFVNTFAGGLNSPTLPDVSNAVTTAEAQSIAASAVATALTQMAVSNAQSVDSIRQVVQNAALAGAAQIPPVQLAPQETNVSSRETSAGGE